MKTIQNSVSLRFIAIFLLLTFSSSVFGASILGESQSAVRIPGGTPVILELNQYIDSEHGYYSDQIHFRVKYDVKVDGKTVIAAGSIAYGHIVQLQKRKGFGQPGYVELKVDRVMAVDGTQVTLSSSSLRAEGDNREGVAIGLGVGLCCVIGPFGLLFFCIKGGPAEIYPGAEINAITQFDIEVNTL